jgi:guanylate kinase
MTELEGKCIIVCAPSGAGKSTIVNFLLAELPDLAFSVSATSRSPRANEEHGTHYYFMSPAEFKRHRKNNDFIEWEEVYKDQFYGTLKSEIERIWKKKKHVIFDVDVEGGVNLKKIFGDRALAVFIKPPRIEVLEERLKARGTESEETLAMRLEKAAQELSYEGSFDVTVINDDLDTARADALSRVKTFLES